MPEPTQQCSDVVALLSHLLDDDQHRVVALRHSVGDVADGGHRGGVQEVGEALLVPLLSGVPRPDDEVAAQQGRDLGRAQHLKQPPAGVHQIALAPWRTAVGGGGETCVLGEEVVRDGVVVVEVDGEQLPSRRGRRRLERFNGRILQLSDVEVGRVVAVAEGEGGKPSLRLGENVGPDSVEGILPGLERVDEVLDGAGNGLDAPRQQRGQIGLNNLVVGNCQLARITWMMESSAAEWSLPGPRGLARVGRRRGSR